MEVKWIKIVTDIFSDEKILLIEAMPDADAIIVIWFKLLCLAGKQNNGGIFMLNDRMPYNDEMFASIFRRNVNTVRMALRVFEDFEMIEIIDNIVTIPNWSKHQSLDTYERQKEKDKLRKREERARKKILAGGSSNTSPLPAPNMSADTSRDTSMDASRDMSRDTSRDTSSDASSDASMDVRPVDKEEDKDIELYNTISSEPLKKASEQVVEPAVYNLPLNDGTLYGITQQEIAEYVNLYPAVDVHQQIRNMIGWLNASPVNRKTRRGIKKFINGWLARNQDSGGARNPPYGKGRPPVMPQAPPRTVPEGTNPFKRT